jgi:CelD/BcsL family acetyltransferase involved in cellulose biosynthesis
MPDETFCFELRDFQDLAELERLWLDLEQRAAGTIFLSWNWIGCWLRETSLRPTVLIGHAAARVVLLGVVTASTRRALRALTVQGFWLHMTGDPREDVITIEYNGFLVEQGLGTKIEADAIAFLLRGTDFNGSRQQELHLKNAPSTLEVSVRASGFPFRELQRKPSWRIDLAAIRAARKHHLDTISANSRQQIRRSMRLYESRGPLVLARARDVAEALGFLEGLKVLHQRYWQARGEPGGFAFPFFERFQQRLIRSCLDHGAVELVRVSVGADVIGYVYNLVYRGHVYAYQTGLNYEDDPRLKPGLVSHCLCINRHLEEGDDVYDFMAGEGRYKASLGKPGPEMVYLLAERRTAALRLEAALHDAKRRLGALARRTRRRSVGS